MDLKPTDDLSQRLAGAQFDLYGFISVLMRGVDEVADVLQETNLTILKHGANYDPDRPFLPWARGVARNCIAKFYSARSRERLVFDEALMDRIAEWVPSVTDERPLEDLTRLRHCMARLAAKQRDFVTARYIRGEAVKDIAAREKCSEGAVSMMLHRVRQLLADCMVRERERARAGGCV